MSLHHQRRRTLNATPGLMALVLLTSFAAACATGGSGGGGGDDDDDVMIDSSIMGLPDSGQPTPDAPVGPTIDAGNGCATQPCDVSPQCGCAPGMACDLDPANVQDLACRAANPAGTQGTTCIDDVDCAIGTVCLGNPSHCQTYCETNGDCSGGPGALCTIGIVDGTGATIDGVQTCSINCTPNTSAGCPVPQGCHVFIAGCASNADCNSGSTCDTVNGYCVNGTQAVNFTSCMPSGAAGQGAACTTGNDCQAGFGCFNTPAVPPAPPVQCLKWCELVPGPASCPAGAMCYMLDPQAIIGIKEYGVCYTP